MHWDVSYETAGSGPMAAGWALRWSSAFEEMPDANVHEDVLREAAGSKLTTAGGAQKAPSWWAKM